MAGGHDEHEPGPAAPLPDPATFEGDGHEAPPTEMFMRALAEPIPASEIAPGELEGAISRLQSVLLRYVDPPYELESRWMAARALIQRGHPGAALRLIEEALVLAGAMLELESAGHSSDLLDTKIDSRISRRLAKLKAPAPEVPAEELERRARAVAEEAFLAGLAGDGFQAAVRAALERRLEQHLHEQGFAAAVRALVERRLGEWVGEEPFHAAAAAAAAARPQGLLDRPETRARMETVATHTQRAFLGSARFAERVAGLLTQRGGELLGDERLRGLVEELTGRRLEVWLDSPELQARLSQVGPERPGAPAEPAGRAPDPRQLAALLEGPELREALERGLVRLLGPDGPPATRAALEARLLELLRGSPAAGRWVEDRVLSTGARLAEEARAQAVKEAAQALTKAEERLASAARGPAPEEIGEMVREQVHTRIEAALASPALDARVKRAVESALLRLEERLSNVVEAQMTARVRALVDERLGDRLPRAVAEAMDAPLARALEPVRAGLEKRVEKQLEGAFPELLARALGEGQPAQQRLQEAVDSALKRNVDEERVVRMVRKELLNRQALQNASLSGEGLVDQATAIGRMVEDKLKELRAQERGPRRPPPPPPEKR